MGTVLVVGLDLSDTQDIEYSESWCGSLLNVKILYQPIPFLKFILIIMEYYELGTSRSDGGGSTNKELLWKN